MLLNQPLHFSMCIPMPVATVTPATKSQKDEPAFSPLSIQISEIYQAAAQRAAEDHQLDKLFNPDYYDYHI
jgi:hypothetical protein